MKLITLTTIRTKAIAQPAMIDLYHPEGYWCVKEDGDTIFDSLSPLPDSIPPLSKKAMFEWESHTNITGGSMRIKEATLISRPDCEGPVLMIDGYLIAARLATPYSLEYPPNFATGNVNGVYAHWDDFIYTGRCTDHHEPITQALVDHINQIIQLQNRIDALKASFGR